MHMVATICALMYLIGMQYSIEQIRWSYHTYYPQFHIFNVMCLSIFLYHPLWGYIGGIDTKPYWPNMGKVTHANIHILAYIVAMYV